MKKLDSHQHQETPEAELKRRRNRVVQLDGKDVKKLLSDNRLLDEQIVEDILLVIND